MNMIEHDFHCRIIKDVLTVLKENNLIPKETKIRREIYQTIQPYRNWNQKELKQEFFSVFQDFDSFEKFLDTDLKY